MKHAIEQAVLWHGGALRRASGALLFMQAMLAVASSMDNNEDDFKRETVLLGSVNLLSGNRLHVGAEWHQ